MRIKALEIRDFKAFCGTHTIQLTDSCKNLLVLGENGSGKTSLVRALDGALAASRGPVLFEKNIFAGPGGGYVKVVLERGGEFYWREDGTHLGTTPDIGSLLSDAAKAKRLMDYKGLLKTYLLDTETVNLFELLLREVLADCINPITNRSFLEDWQALAGLIPRQNTEKQKNALYDALKVFNDGFSATLARMTVKARILLHEFDEALEFDLKFSGVLYEEASKTLKGREVWLMARFHGRDLTRHHHLLNEARLSAVGLCLYFAALLETPQADLKVLMLDDVLIGLDMENRLPVLKVLERPEFAVYQVFMLTYDPIWFDIVRQTVERSGIWKCLEMRKPLDVAGEIPIVDGGNFLSVARKHLQRGDFRSAANYTRSAFETTLQNFCKKQDVPVKFRSRLKDYKSDDFWKALLQWQQTAPSGTAVDAALESKVELVRAIVLNPLSHAQILGLTTREVKEAYDVVVILDNVLAAMATTIRTARSASTSP
ncbi:hypothetical protein [Deinococcus sp. UYEF24]